MNYKTKVQKYKTSHTTPVKNFRTHFFVQVYI